MKTLFLLVLLAALTVGCRDKSIERKKAEENVKDWQEFIDAASARNAPLIAARHNLPVELVRRILLFEESEERRRAIERSANKISTLDLSVSDKGELLDRLSAQEKVDRRTIAEVLFDNAVMDCRD